MMKKQFAAALLAAMSLVTSAAASAAQYVEGKHYVRLSPAQPVANPSKIEVVEFFWYACPHCYRLQAPLDAWLATAPKDIDYKPTPAVLSARWGILARAYYAQEANGPVDRKLHMAIFKAIHEGGENLEKPEALFKLVEKVKGKEYGLKFQQAYGSFGVQAKLGKGPAMARSYQISGTPTLVVDGIYAVSPATAGSEAGMVPILDYLTKMQRAKKQKENASLAPKPAAAPVKKAPAK